MIQPQDKTYFPSNSLQIFFSFYCIFSIRPISTTPSPSIRESCFGIRTSQREIKLLRFLAPEENFVFTLNYYITFLILFSCLFLETTSESTWGLLLAQASQVFPRFISDGHYLRYLISTWNWLQQGKRKNSCTFSSLQNINFCINNNP